MKKLVQKNWFYPHNVDTALSEILVFKLFRAEPDTGAVSSPAIVATLDIIKHCRPHDFPAGKALSVDTFHFQRVKEAFHAGIIITTAFRTHASSQIMQVQLPLIFRRTVLLASVLCTMTFSRRFRRHSAICNA